jgi:hypothetical protein
MLYLPNIKNESTEVNETTFVFQRYESMMGLMLQFMTNIHKGVVSILRRKYK